MSDPGAPSRSSSLITVVSVALVAYAACDMIHEAIGHGTAVALMPGVEALSISTVAVQTSAQSRLVAAAGSIANVLVGALLLVLARRRGRLDTLGYFLWLLATLNLLNGTGYLFFSGLTETGDWTVVVAGWNPEWIWRALLVVLGAASYSGVVVAAAAVLSRLLWGGGPDEAVALTLPAYIAGGLLLVAGAAMNPIGMNLIWLSGVSSGFGAMAGLLVIPRLVKATDEVRDGVGLRFHLGWALAAALTAAVFVFVIGRGIPLRPS